VLAGLFGLWIMASLRYELPRLPIAVGLVGAVLPVLLFFVPAGNPIQSFLLSGLAAGAVSLLALYALYRAMKREPAAQAVPA
jgi:xanthine/uracil permease